MQTCKKCLHYEVCRLGNLQYQTPYERYETKFIKKLDSSRCGNFKDSSKFIELPNKIEYIEPFEVKGLADSLLTISQNMEFNGCDDPFRSYFQGVQDAIELSLNAIKTVIKKRSY